MEIRYKFIQDERTEDAPFVGALISAIGCKNKCKGCFNRHLKTYPTLKNTAEEIIEMVKSNPFNEGIILGGLEWSEQPIELIELCKVASENGLKVMIYTGCETLGEFQSIIGNACADKVGYSDMLNKAMLTDFDKNIYTFIGAMVLDNTIPDDYYIKVGRFERELKQDGVIHFGVALASKNQRVYKIVKERE